MLGWRSGWCWSMRTSAQRRAKARGRVGAVPGQQDGEEDLSAAVLAGGTPECLKKSRFPSLDLGWGPDRGLRPVKGRGAWLREGHGDLLGKREGEVPNATQRGQRLGEAFGHMRGLFSSSKEGEVGAEAAGDRTHG